VILAAQQPNYLPWIGFFHKVASADLLVLADHVQYSRRGITNRNVIKGPAGPVRLTVPVLTSGQPGVVISEARIDNASPWRRSHWRTIQTCYGRAPHFASHAEFFESLLAREWTRLAPLNEEIIRYMMRAFGIEKRILRSSELRPEGAKTELVVSLCRLTGAEVYLSGTGARKYMDEDACRRAGLTVRYQQFRHPVYPQLHGPFLPNLSALDLLFNVGSQAGELIGRCGDPGPAAPEGGREGKEDTCSGES